jgi:ribosomal protein L6P/L9E
VFGGVKKEKKEKRMMRKLKRVEELVLPDNFSASKVSLFLGPLGLKGASVGVLVMGSEHYDFIPLQEAVKNSTMLASKCLELDFTLGSSTTVAMEGFHFYQLARSHWSSFPYDGGVGLLGSRLPFLEPIPFYERGCFLALTPEVLTIVSAACASDSAAVKSIRASWAEVVYQCLLSMTSSVRTAGAIESAVIGVSRGFERELQLVGVGYTAGLLSSHDASVEYLDPGVVGILTLDVGKSHKISYLQGKITGVCSLEEFVTVGKSSERYYVGSGDCGLRVYSSVPSGTSVSGVGKGVEAAKGKGKGKVGNDKGTTSRVVVFGPDKDAVHQFAARIVSCCPHSVYGGRGISVYGADLKLKPGKKK